MKPLKALWLSGFLLCLAACGDTEPEPSQPSTTDTAPIVEQTAEAVQAVFPGTQITFGPATDDGFYYDVMAPADRAAMTDWSDASSPMWLACSK